MTSRDIPANMQHSSSTNIDPQNHRDSGDVGSILSSRMTDIASDDEREQTSGTRKKTAAQRAQRRSLQTAASNSRPGTGASTQRGAWPQQSSSRRGPSSSIGVKTGSVAGSIGARPQSAASRSHIPSLTPQAFFRPMSSKRLQAQRQGGSRTVIAQGLSADDSIEAGRGSTTPTMRRRDEDYNQRPLSRGTEITELDTVGRFTANTSPTYGHNPAGSISESVRPLQKPTSNSNLKGLSLNIDNSAVSAPGKSPRSFRSSFLLPIKPSSDSPNRNNQGGEKLPSIASSPGYTPVDASKKFPKQNLGNNYQYFTGNTVFCWGGRLQNTRDRPVNILTGILVIVPCVLFIAFSAPWYWHNISPAVPIIFGYIFYICISSFVHASVSDPGVSSFPSISSSSC